jgi:hypothetical protein
MTFYMLLRYTVLQTVQELGSAYIHTYGPEPPETCCMSMGGSCATNNT